jgi:hypothetical protein
VLAEARWAAHGRGRPGSSAAREAPARAEGGPGWGAARAERVGHGRGGRGRGGTGHVEEMREREAGERKGGTEYTRLCSLGRHINRRT